MDRRDLAEPERGSETPSCSARRNAAVSDPGWPKESFPLWLSFESRTRSSAEEIQVFGVHPKSIAIDPLRTGRLVFHDPVNAVNVPVPAAIGVTVFAGIATGQQSVAPVFRGILSLRENDHLPGVGIDDADDFLPRMSAVPFKHGTQQASGSSDEKEPRCPEVFINRRSIDVH